MTDQIASELRIRDTWLLNRKKFDPARDKLSRVPHGSDGKPTNTNPEKFMKFEDACAALPRFDGLTFALTGDGVACVDLDNCRDAQTGELTATAQEIVSSFGDTYIEISDSGKGLHIWCHGRLPKNSHPDKSWVELYDHAKPIAMTGNVERWDRSELLDCQDALTALFQRCEAKEFCPQKPSSPDPTTRTTGDLSADDFRLALRLARENHCDESATLRAFLQQSKNTPQKLARRDYAPRTVKNAIATVQATNSKPPEPAVTMVETPERCIIEAKPVILSPSVPAVQMSAPQMSADAYYGLAGDFVRRVAPETEADPVALLGNFLISAGVLFGREIWAFADGQRHYPIEYLMMIGNTGGGRKGTATARVLPVIEAAEEGFSQRVLSGLSSGEGLIKGIAPKNDDEKTSIRRYLVLLPEFASLLGVMKREGNTLSATLRQAWDGNRLRVLTRHDPLDVDNVNLSAIVHITRGELLSNLSETEKVNGFANRFLFILVHRSKFLPEGGKTVELNDIVQRLRAAIEFTRGRGQIERDEAARELWSIEYPKLAAERTGLRGALCSRAEAHVLRLSLLYAVLDLSPEIRCEHIRAAIAFWNYCERSVEHVFGTSTGDRNLEKLLRVLDHGPACLTDFHRACGNHVASEWLLGMLAQMVDRKLIRQTTMTGSKKETIPAWEKADRSQSFAN